MWVSHPKETNVEKEDAGARGHRTRGCPDQLGGQERRNGTGGKNTDELGADTGCGTLRVDLH